MDNEAIEAINQLYDSGHSMLRKRASEPSSQIGRTGKDKDEQIPKNSSDTATLPMTDAPATPLETTTIQEEETTVPPPLAPTKKPTPKPKPKLYKEPEDFPR